MLFFGGEFSLPLLIAIGIVLLFGMGWHEYAHAIVADWWGDTTPRQYGRLTPNPFVHIYWPGWLMFVVLGFGILGSVPVNPRLMRDARWGSFWTSLAGPLSNLVMAIISALLLRLLFDPITALRFFISPNSVSGPMDFIALLLVVSVFYNILLFVFNLLPFFPIDGWHIVMALLPGSWMRWADIPAFIRTNLSPMARFMERPAYKWGEWAMLSQYVLFFLIFLSFVPALPSPLGVLIGQPTQQLFALLMGF